MTPVVLIRVGRTPNAQEQHPRHLHAPLDLLYIRSALTTKARLRPPLFDGWLINTDKPPLVKQVMAKRPKYAVIHAMSWCIDEACTLARQLRQQGIITIAIGEQVTHRAKKREPHTDWDSCWDIPVLGEPQQSVPALLLELQRGHSAAKLGPHYWQRLKAQQPFQVTSPDLLPNPVFSSSELTQYPFPFPLPGKVMRRWAYVMSNWGCPYNCQHCTEVVRKSIGQNLRLRDPAKIADEIQQLVQQGAEGIVFEDDTLFCHRRHLLALCNEIKRRSIKVRWIANARPDELDKERVAAAASAGAILLKLGIESGSPRMIENLGKCHSGTLWLDQTSAAVQRLKQHGIASVGLYMVGMPYETEAEVKQSMHLAKKLDSDYVQVQRFTAYPDVAMINKTSVTASSHGNMYHYTHHHQSRSNISSQHLEKLQQAFYFNYYLRPSFISRHLRRCWHWYVRPDFLLSLPGKIFFLLGWHSRRHILQEKTTTRPDRQGAIP